MDSTNANTALASAFTEELARCGVSHAVISPGSRSTPLAVALWRQEGIEVEVILDERSAGFYALGAAQASGEPVAVLCTSGSAAANLHPAAVEADEAAVPLLILTADRPPELRGIGAGQTIDQLKLYGSAVRWFCDVGTHEAGDDGLIHYRSTACRAYATARGDPRPGPVHLNFEWREPLAPHQDPGSVTTESALALEGRGSEPLTKLSAAPAAPPPGLLEEAAAAIGASERGVIICGRRPETGDAPLIAELALRSGYPILAEPTSQMRLGPHDRSMVISAYDSIARSRPEGLEPDLVIRFGDMTTSKALRSWIADLGPGQIVINPHGWNEPSRRATTIVRSDPGLAAAGLRDLLAPPSRDGGWTGAWLAADQAVITAHATELAALGELSEPGLHRALGAAHADGDLVYTASSMPIRDQEEFVVAASTSVRFLCNRGANGIDGLLSSGIGAARASGRPTTIILGDLGLVHDMGGLLALRSLGTPVRIVVIDNGGGGIFHFLPQAKSLSGDEFEALLGTPSGIGPGQLAALCGIEHRPVTSLDELPAALAAGTGLISITVDRHRNVEIHQRLRDAASRALHASP
ncbi:MAG: 2-succinyl-5-enolpyruvyl-6-hydroxy-3-cyclohexene-1-carboxylic-acid synthase [Solirubrobacterales bacterium]